MTDNDNNNQNSTEGEGQTKALSPMQQSANMVYAYAKKLVGDDRAQQFFTTLRVLVQKEPKIGMSTPESVLASMMACVHLDMIPNTPEGYAYIIPYKNKFGKFEAQFQVGYKGMVQLAYRSGLITGINAELVFPEDSFEVDFGNRTISHKPNLTIDRTDYSKAIACYAVATLPNGGITFDVLSRSEIEKVRKVSKAKSTDAPWSQWEESMVKKTAVKRLTKTLPQSTNDKLVLAAAMDSWAQAGRLKLEGSKVIEGKANELDESERAALNAEAKSIAANLKEQEGSGDDGAKAGSDQRAGGEA